MRHWLAAQDSVCTLTLKGKVLDKNSGHILAQASIAVAETQEGTLTDDFGRFQLSKLCKGPITISISHIGCETQTFHIDLRRDTTIKIKLDHQEIELDEVQVLEAKKE